MRVTIYIDESQARALHEFFREIPAKHCIDFHRERKNPDQVEISISYQDYEILKVWRSEHSDQESIINS